MLHGGPPAFSFEDVNASQSIPEQQVREKKATVKEVKEAAKKVKAEKAAKRKEAKRRNAMESYQICEANRLRKTMTKSKKAALSQLPVKCNLSEITDEQLGIWILSLQLERDRRLHKWLKGELQ